MSMLKDAAFAKDHPAEPLHDAVLTAMERPEVDTARVAFLNYVAEVTGDRMFPTNYYDTVLFGALRVVASNRPSNLEAAYRLVELYCSFVDALAPYQPDAEAVSATGTMPWDAENTDGKVFYFVPCSGGYWVEGSTKFRGMLASACEQSRRSDVTH